MSLNAAHYFEMAAKKTPEQTAIVLDDYSASYGETLTYARKVANVLRDKGVKPGDNVVMMIPNVPQFPIIYYGILMAGGTVVPINTMLKTPEIEFFLEDSEAKLFITWNRFEEASVEAFNLVDSCTTLLVASEFDEEYQPSAGKSLRHLMDAASDEFDTVATMPDDVAVIIYTSGTTGRPKGAMLTHFNIFFNAYCAQEHLLFYKPGEHLLVILPLFHSFGQTILMNAVLFAGATMSLVPSMDMRKALEIIKRDKVALLALVPSMFHFILSHPRADEYGLEHVRSALSGGAALPVEVFKGFEERFGIRITEGYGLSETSPLASFNPFDRPSKPASIGTPLWGTEMAIMREDNSFADVDEVGEVVMRGHNIMKGYYKQPGATAESIVNGWFKSGDLGKRDGDGYFYIVDRKKNMVIVNGMNVYPREIEEVLYAHPAIHEAAVIGVPDKTHGEVVKAYISLREGATVESKDVRRYCGERLARYKVPRKIEIVDSLPKGPTGKILHRELREQTL